LARPHFVLLAAALLYGCSTQASTPNSSTATSPLGTYKVILRDEPALQQAEQSLIEQCMAREHIKYVPPPPPSKDGQPLTEPLTTATAVREGYPQLLPKPKSAAEVYIASLSETDSRRYRTALVGADHDKIPISVNGSSVLMPNSGCQSQAERAVYGDRKRWAPLHLLIFNLTGQRQFSTSADAELATATTRWSHCMTAAGRPFDSPADAIAAAAAAANTSGVSTSGTPKAIAVADATCRAHTNWDAENAAAAGRALSGVTTTFAKQLTQYRSLQLAALSRIQESK
jgi:hypothetical protein